MKLLNKNFLLLVGSQLFSVLGTTIAQFAISLYVLDKTGSMSVFSVVLSLSMISRILFLPFGGIVADRLPKKRLMLFMDFIYLILSLFLAIGVIQNNSIVIMGVVSIVLGIVSSFETPVVQSAIPMVCDREYIPQANGIINSIAMLSNILAPVFVGIIYNFEKAYITFSTSALFFLLAVICEIFLVVKQQEKKKTKDSMINILKQDTKETVGYLRKNRVIIKICFIAFLLNFFISSFMTVIIPYTARVEWEVSNASFGIMNTLFALGGLLGSILVSIFASKINGRGISKLFLLNSFVFLALSIPYSNILGNHSSFWTMTIITTILQGTFTMVSIQLISFVQMVTEEALLGRVMSFIMMFSMLAMPLGQLIYGNLGNVVIGKEAIVMIAVVGLISIIISMYSSNVFKNITVVKGNI